MNFKEKVFGQKDIFSLGFSNLVGSGIAAIFWFYLASLLSPEQYGQIHYFLGIAGIAYIITLFGTQQTITVYSAKKTNVISTIFFLSILTSLGVALIVFTFYNQIDISFLLIGYTVNELALGYLIGKKLFSNYFKYVLTQRTLTFILGFSFYFIFGVEGIIFALALSYIHFSLLVYKGLKDSSINFSSLKTHSGFITNNYVIAVVGGFRGNVDKVIIGPLLGFALLGNYVLALQFYVVLMLIPNLVFKYTLSHDASGIPTTKIKLLTFMFAVATCISTIIISPHIIPLFFEKFVDVVIAIQILSIGVIPATAVLLYTSKFLGLEKSKNPLIGLLIQVTITVLGIVILGQNYEIVGIAISYVLASFGNFIYLFFANKFLEKSQK